MARKRRGIMSEELKDELAKDLGFYDTVQKEGWGGIRAKDAGNMVKRALQIAEQTLAAQSSGAGTSRPSAASSAPNTSVQPRQTGPGTAIAGGFGGMPAYGATAAAGASIGRTPSVGARAGRAGGIGTQGVFGSPGKTGSARELVAAASVAAQSTRGMYPEATGPAGMQ